MTEEDWYVGARQGHTHMVGWGGLEVNGGHVTAEDILNETNYDWRSLVAGVWISELLTAGAELPWPRAQHALGCAYIDVQQIIRLRNISLTASNYSEIFITVRAKPELTDFSVVVEDRRRAAVRTIKSNFQAYSGTRIGEEGRRSYIKYFLSISQFQYSERDQEGNESAVL